MGSEENEGLFFLESDISNVSVGGVDEKTGDSRRAAAKPRNDSGPDVSGKLRVLLEEMSTGFDSSAAEPRAAQADLPGDIRMQINRIKNSLEVRELPHSTKGLEEPLRSLKSDLVYVKEYRTQSGRLIKAHYRNRPPRK